MWLFHLAFMAFRMLYHRLLLTLNYVYILKNNPTIKCSAAQMMRENNSHIYPIIGHTIIIISVELLYPQMFINNNPTILCLLYSALTHAFIVEPIYYVSHRIFHTRFIYLNMHKHHHLSVDTFPTTGITQNSFEHLLYNVIFSPAAIVPHLLLGMQNTTGVFTWLFMFDMLNAFGHTSINMPKWYSKSWMKYILYPPMFHKNHHARLRVNYSLFMPIYDKLFGTYYECDDQKFNHHNIIGQDMTLLCHPSGFCNALHASEINYYDGYKEHYTVISLPIDIFLLQTFGSIYRRFVGGDYTSNCFTVDKRIICRRSVLSRSPFDYMKPELFPIINKELIDVIHNKYYYHGTKKFALTNMNKNKQLNNCGLDLIKYLPKDVLLWTGDSMSCASVYNYLNDNKINNIFFIGGTGKIGKVVCKMLAKRNIRIMLYSTNVERANEIVRFNPDYISVTNDFSQIHNYKNIVLGKYMKLENLRDKNIYDYNVPFIKYKDNNHTQIGIIKDTRQILTGFHESVIGTRENETYACFAGCFINSIINRGTHEVGEIDENDVISVWAHAQSLGFMNR